MDGVLVIDKPPGSTSARVVSKVKRILGEKRVGHTGTLDPMATGVLPIVVGEGTKIAGYLLADDKAYEGELMLGVETDTLDAEGSVTGGDDARAAAVTPSELRAVVAAHTGALQQIPPMYSALKQGGRRLHQLARRGEEVERPPRAVRVDAFDIIEVVGPRVRFSVACSKGTYVRALARDVGWALGCGAHLTALRRTRSGDFDLSAAVALADLNTDRAAAALVAPHDALARMPSVMLPEALVPRVGNGGVRQWDEVSAEAPPDGPVALLAPGRGLVALVDVSAGKIDYRRVFRYALTSGESSSIVPPETEQP